MPLIHAIGRFFQRRMEVGYASADYGDAIRAEYRGDLGGFGSVSSMGGMVWFVIMLAAVPLILFLVLVGLIYELVIRLGRHRLPPLSDWTLSLLAAIALVGAGIWWVASALTLA